MEEYKTLRQESLNSLEQAHRSVQIGLAAIAAITAFGATSASGAGMLQDVAIAIAAPIVAALAWVLWLLEVRRSMRAGRYIARLEHRINERVSDPSPEHEPALGWEIKMLGEKADLGSHAYNRIVPLMLIATSILSVAVGLTRLGDHREWGALAATGFFDALVLVVARRYDQCVKSKIAKGREEALEEIHGNSCSVG